MLKKKILHITKQLSQCLQQGSSFVKKKKLCKAPPNKEKFLIFFYETILNEHEPRLWSKFKNKLRTNYGW